MTECDFCSRTGDEGVDIVVFYELSICSYCCENILIKLEDDDYEFGVVDVVKSNDKWSVLLEGKELGVFDNLIQASAKVQGIAHQELKYTVRILGERAELLSYVKTNVLRRMISRTSFESLLDISNEEDRLDLCKRYVEQLISKRYKSVYQLTDEEAEELQRSVMKDLAGV